ncbi:hypothetical protein SMWOGL2_09300 [Sporomusa malonica]
MLRTLSKLAAMLLLSKKTTTWFRLLLHIPIPSLLLGIRVILHPRYLLDSALVLFLTMFSPLVRRIIKSEL